MNEVQDGMFFIPEKFAESHYSLKKTLLDEFCIIWKLYKCKEHHLLFCDFKHKIQASLLAVARRAAAPTARYLPAPRTTATNSPLSARLPHSPVFFFTSSAIWMPSSINSTTFSKSASLNCRDVSAGVPGRAGDRQAGLKGR